MKQDKWEERLERHLADYEKSPSHDLWEGIESGLQKEMKRQARMVTLRRWMIAAALVGVVSGGTICSGGTNSRQTYLIRQDKQRWQLRCRQRQKIQRRC